MMKSQSWTGYWLWATVVVAALCMGCRESEDDRLAKPPKDPKAAASALEQAFADADEATRNNASVASQALREGSYGKAVASMVTMQNQDNLTFEQGMTVRNSMVTLQQALVNAAENGDPRAQEAIRMLQQGK